MIYFCYFVLDLFWGFVGVLWVFGLFLGCCFFCAAFMFFCCCFFVLLFVCFWVSRGHRLLRRPGVILIDLSVIRKCMSLKALDSYIDLPFRRHISVNKCADCVVKQNISFLSSFPGVQLAVSSAAIIY